MENKKMLKVAQVARSGILVWKDAFYDHVSRIVESARAGTYFSSRIYSRTRQSNERQ